jgi:hypothetical protein
MRWCGCRQSTNGQRHESDFRESHNHESSTTFETQEDFLGKPRENDVYRVVMDSARANSLTYEVAVPNRQAKFRELMLLMRTNRAKTLFLEQPSLTS